MTAPPYAHVTAAIKVLRMIRGNGGENIATAAEHRAAAHLVALRYARTTRSGYAITRKGIALLARFAPRNRYGATGAW